MWKFHKTGVITGDLDNYCLVCEELLQSDVDEHIEKPLHIEFFNKTVYVDKFRDDLIRKVKRGYYCEFCNILLVNCIQVNIHVIDDMHILNRNKKIYDHNTVKHFKRIGNAIIVLDDMLIQDAAWNAFNEGCCALCTTELENANIANAHKIEVEHILKLIQIKTEMDLHYNLYRKFKDSIFQCLICNVILPEKSFSDHCATDNHKMLRFQSRKDKWILAKSTRKEETANGEPKPIKSVNEELKSIYSVTDEPKAIKSVTDELNPIKSVTKEIKSIKSVAEERQVAKDESKPIKAVAEKPKPIKFVTDEPKPIKSVNEEPKPFKSVKEEPKPNKSVNENNTKKANKYNICEMFGINDFIYVNHINEAIHCILCDWPISGGVQDHTASVHHQKILELQMNWFDSNRKESNPKTKSKTKSDESATSNLSTENGSELNEIRYDDRCDIIKSLVDFQNNTVHIDVITQTVNCKKCTKTLDFDLYSVKKHIEEHSLKETAELNKSKLQPNTAIIHSNLNNPNNDTTLLTNHTNEKIDPNVCVKVKNNRKEKEDKNKQKHIEQKDEEKQKNEHKTSHKQNEHKKEPKAVQKQIECKTQQKQKNGHKQNDHKSEEKQNEAENGQKQNEHKSKQKQNDPKTGQKQNECKSEQTQSEPKTILKQNEQKHNEPKTGQKQRDCKIEQKQNEPKTGHKQRECKIEQKQNEPKTSQKQGEGKTEHKQNEPKTTQKQNESKQKHNESKTGQKQKKSKTEKKQNKSKTELKQNEYQTVTTEQKPNNEITDHSRNEKKEIKNNTQQSDNNEAVDTEEEEKRMLAKEHHISCNSNHGSYCNMCKINMPNCLSNIKEHVIGTRHRRTAARKLQEEKPKALAPKPLYATVRIQDYLRYVTMIENFYRQDVIINESFCVDMYSFALYIMVARRIRCQACEVTFDTDEIITHRESTSHVNKVQRIPVVVMKGEFIREIRNGIFHCGFCNILEAGWEMLGNHLKSQTHKEWKQIGEWQLIEHTAAIRRANLRREPIEFNSLDKKITHIRV